MTYIELEQFVKNMTDEEIQNILYLLGERIEGWNRDSHYITLAKAAMSLAIIGANGPCSGFGDEAEGCIEYMLEAIDNFQRKERYWMPETFNYNGVDVRFETLKYEGGDLAVQMLAKYDYWEPYAVITKNFDADLAPNAAFLDVNNVKNIDKWLIENGLAKETPWATQSGYCVYPLVEFTEKFFKAAIDGRSN